MASDVAGQMGIGLVAVLIAVGQLALTIFSGSRVEHVRAQHMANLAAAIAAADHDPRDPDADVVADLRSDLRIATMQYRVARLTQTSLRLWVPYWLLLLGTVVVASLTLTAGSGSTRVTSSPGTDVVSIPALIVAPLLLHLTAAYATRRRQRPAIDAVDPAYLTVDPPSAPGDSTGSSAAVGRLPRWLARELWQEDQRARHDLRRRRLQPRLAFWSIRLTSVVTGLISGVALSLGVATVLHRIDPPPAKHMLLDGVIVEVVSTGARDAAVLSVVALPWIVLVYWVTWLLVERPWNIRPKGAQAAGSKSKATAAPAWLALGLIGSLLSRSPTQPDRADPPTAP